MSFSKLEEEILRCLSAHIAQNDEISLTELASECHVAKSTVVKAVQKLGYKGFEDLTYSVRFNAQGSDGNLLPRAVVNGEYALQVDMLSRCFVNGEGRRNFVFSGDRRTGRLLALYVSRKLAMFDIFCPASYDYAMASASSQPSGVAFFCFHRELPGKERLGQQEGFAQGMLRSAQEAGFRIVAFTDNDERLACGKDGLTFRISDNDGTGADLYVAKVLMLFEAALSRYAQQRG